MRLLNLAIAIFLSGIVPGVAQTSLPPDAPLKIRLEFRIKPEELNELRTTLAQFAQNEQLTVNDIGAQMPPRQGRPLFHLELERQDRSVKITVTNIRAEDRMFVWFYEYRAGSALAEMDTK